LTVASIPVPIESARSCIVMSPEPTVAFRTPMAWEYVFTPGIPEASVAVSAFVVSTMLEWPTAAPCAATFTALSMFGTLVPSDAMLDATWYADSLTSDSDCPVWVEISRTP